MSEHEPTGDSCPALPGPLGPGMGGCPVSPGGAGRPGRRSFLRGVLGASAVGAAMGVAGMCGRLRAADTSPAAGSADPQGLLPAVPFHGVYQAGILPPPQRQTIALAFDVTAGNRGELADLLQTLTERSRFLTVGGIPTPAGVTGPPSDSGVLGATVVPDGLTVTVGVGHSLFDGRFGLASRKPVHLTAMTPVPQRQPRSGPMRGRPERSALCGKYRYAPACAARYHPAHQGWHAGALAHRRLLQPAEALRHPP